MWAASAAMVLGQDEGAAIGLIAHERRALGAEQSIGLLDDRVENELGGGTAGHERGEAAQRRLLLGVAPAIGDVSPGGIEQLVVGPDPALPLDPMGVAVAIQIAVLEGAALHAVRRVRQCLSRG